MSLHLRHVAPAACLALILTACGGGSDSGSAPDDAATSSPAAEPTTPTPSESSESAEPTTAPPVQAVSQATEDAFFAALDGVVQKFTRFEREYDTAVAAKSARDLLAAGRRLRDGLFAFDAQVRGLDLSAVQVELNALLDINGTLIADLDAVAGTTSGQEARAALRALDLRAFTDAFSEVAAGM